MKFAQSLEEHLVPEWREQYLDYKAGKKQIKKLKKRTSVIEAAKLRAEEDEAQRPPSSPADDLGSQATMRRYGSAAERATPSTLGPGLARTMSSISPVTPVSPIRERLNSMTFGSISDTRPPSTSFRRVTFGGSSIAEPLSLPSPAINPMQPLNVDNTEPEADEGPIDGTTTIDSSTEESTSLDLASTVIDESSAAEPVNSRTPLLAASSPRALTSPQVPHNTPRTPMTFNTPRLMSRRSTVSRLFDSWRGQSTTASLRNSKGSLVSATELDDMAMYAKQQFVAWVDSELAKVDSFFRLREQDSLERFLVLQDQLVQLTVAKDRMNNVISSRPMLASSGNPNRSNHNGMLRRRLAKRRNSDASEDDFDMQLDDDELDNADANQRKSGNKNDDSLWPQFLRLTAWTKRRFQITSKFDLPTLPNLDWMRENGKAEKQYYEDGYDEDESDTESIPDEQAGRRDYARRNPPTGNNKKKAARKDRSPPYYVARRQLKRAVYMFYRSLGLLKSYRLMNRTAFRKLIKKYDKSLGDNLLPSYLKKVDSLYFTTSEVLDNLMVRIEEMFTQNFENGNRKIALSKLRAIQQERTFYVPGFMDGWLLGMALPILAMAFYVALSRTLSGELIQGAYLIQIWVGFVLLCAMAMLFGINCLVWDQYKVNYKLIFEFNPHDNLNFRQFLVIPTFLFLACAVLSWFSFMDFWHHALIGRDWPWLFVIISGLVLLCPFDIFYLSARSWFLSTVTRLVLSGLYPVEFRDFFMGDIFCSLTYSISNTSMFICLYSTHWSDCPACGSSGSRLLGFLSALPNIWRFLQCLRRFGDTGDGFPHLANMGKYFISCIYYMTLSMYRIETTSRNKALLIVFGGLNAFVSSGWDLLMDWSLFQFHSKNFLLRDELTYKHKWVYYTAMVIDVLLRNQWVCYVLSPRYIQQSAITGFAVAVAEVVRRFIWIFFRMENEHATNVHLFRASGDTPLPFPTSKRREPRPLPRPISQDEEAVVGLSEHGEATHVNADASGASSHSYWGALSRVLKMAHIKDFQRRKDRAPSVVSSASTEDDDDENGADTDEDVADDGDYERSAR